MVENRKKHRQNSHPIIHCPTTEGVSEVSKRANEWVQQRARAKRTVRSKRMSERFERTSERTSEWPSTYVSIHACFEPQSIGFFQPRCAFVCYWLFCRRQTSFISFQASFVFSSASSFSFFFYFFFNFPLFSLLLLFLFVSPVGCSLFASFLYSFLKIFFVLSFSLNIFLSFSSSLYYQFLIVVWVFPFNLKWIYSKLIDDKRTIGN